MKNKFILAFLIILFGCQNGNQKPHFQDLPVPVVVTEVIRKDVPINIQAIGIVTSPNVVELEAQVDGKLATIHVKRGDVVEKGQLLFTIETDNYKATLDKAKAVLEKNRSTLAYLEKKLERYQVLAKKDYISALTLDQYTSEVEAAKAQVLSDEADVETAKINYERCFIRSPISGKISDLLTTVGNLVGPIRPNVKLTRIQQISPIHVGFNLTQQEFQVLQKKENIIGLPIEAFLPGENQGHLGEVFFVNNQVDLASGTILLKGLIQNTKRILWPGEYVKVLLKVDTKFNAFLIPTRAIQTIKNENFVFIVSPDDKAETRKIKLGEQLNEFAIVSEGLRGDERVVTEGQINLKVGKKVSITLDGQ